MCGMLKTWALRAWLCCGPRSTYQARRRKVERIKLADTMRKMSQSKESRRERADLIFKITLILTIVALCITLIYKQPVQPQPVVIPITIDRTDTIRIEQIKTYINTYTREPERIIIMQADAVQLDSIIAAQLNEIAKRGW